MLDQSGLRRAFAAAALVTEVAVLTAGCLLLGNLADGYLGSSPWLALIGVFGGFAAGIARLFQALNRLTNDEPEDHPP